MSLVAELRAATRDAHEMVDAAFARFDLTTRDGYRGFLIAHARALPAAEARMTRAPVALDAPPRMPALAEDIVALGGEMPPALTFEDGADIDHAAALGALYVVEGSRLGGALLARSVPDGLPHGYLGAVHEQGAWRALRGAIDDAAEDKDAAWRERAITGALACFDLYAKAAQLNPPLEGEVASRSDDGGVSLSR